MKFRSSLHQRHEKKFSEMIDERTSLKEAEMIFNEMKCKRTSPNVREMSQMK
jgi:RNase H-fold protein (predicted Holliday junction resolvase)